MTDDGIQNDEIPELLKICKREKSEKWFIYFLLGKKYFDEKQYSESIKYLSTLNKYSFFKNRETYEMEILCLLRMGNYREALSKIKKYDVYKSKNIYEELENIFVNIKTEIEPKFIESALYDAGYYELLIKNKELISLDLNKLIKCYFYEKKYDEVRRISETENPDYDEVGYFISRAYSNISDFKKAFRSLEKKKNRNSREEYYYYFYGLLSQDIKVIKSDQMNNIKNYYYRSKLVEQIIEKTELEDEKIKELYEIAKQDEYIGFKLYNRLFEKIDIEPPVNYDYSVFTLYRKDIYKADRELNRNVEIFKIKDKLIKKASNISRYIIYNDIMLTKFNDEEEKIIRLFQGNLPNEAIKLSYSNPLYPPHYKYPTSFYDVVKKYSGLCNIDPLLVWSIIREESLFSDISSSAGANGLMQVMPSTRKWIYDKYSLKETGNRIEDNLKAGIYYLRYLMEKYRNFEKPYLYAIMAYNAGPGNVDKWIKKHRDLKTLITSIPYFETERYLYKVFNTYIDYIRLYDKNKNTLD